MEKVRLGKSRSAAVFPKATYSFRHSTRNPTHYPVPTSGREKNVLRFTTRFRGSPLGIMLENAGTTARPKVMVRVYSEAPLSEKRFREVVSELGFRLEWPEDYSEFYNAFSGDRLLSPVIGKFRGMRSFCMESLYEYLMIAILLQNANVKRTEKMTLAMLGNYGTLLEFGGKELFCFWAPEKILKVSEGELRSLKIGYRAKSFLRASADFLKLSEDEMRGMSDSELKKALLGIYGVGPASLDSIMESVFHRRNALTVIPPWEAKIYSRLLGIPSASPERILAEFGRRYGKWKALAAHYLFMDLAWKHKSKPEDWFAKIMPY
ncbi:MAG: hypothetical protein WC602_01990 [archaeon]